MKAVPRPPCVVDTLSNVQSAVWHTEKMDPLICFHEETLPPRPLLPLHTASGAGPGAALSAAAAHLRNFILDTRLQSLAGPGPGHTRAVCSELQLCENSQT